MVSDLRICVRNCSSPGGNLSKVRTGSRRTVAENLSDTPRQATGRYSPLKMSMERPCSIDVKAEPMNTSTAPTDIIAAWSIGADAATDFENFSYEKVAELRPPLLSRLVLAENLARLTRSTKRRAGAPVTRPQVINIAM